MIFRHTFSYHFCAVGQGLFSWGTLSRDEDRLPRFVWVYDCGTLSSQELVANGIHELAKNAHDRQRIDLLTLSHFDHDHISGVCRLIDNFHIGTLMLPYMPLAQRLIIAFEEGLGQHDELINFFVNPVEYLLGRDGPGIDRILFVPASGNDGPPFPGDGEGEFRPGPDDDRGDDLAFDPHGKPEDSADVQALFAVEQVQSGQTEIAFLARGSSVTYRSLWEFVPYNDDPAAPIPVSFIDTVREATDRLLGTQSRKRKDALRKLKGIYTKQFGEDSRQANEISLFLYAGPIYPTWADCRILGCPYHPLIRAWWHLAPEDDCSLIYTGDGYLDTHAKLERLLNFFGQQRIQRTSVIQVMHHGAEANWHRGVAAAIEPLISVFCSDPLRKDWGHPDATVLRDFWPYGPYQVDKRSSLYLVGEMEQ